MGTIYYFAECFTNLAMYHKAWSQIQSALLEQNEVFELIPNAKDIWARDFMPFQRHDGEFVIYQYNPDYLQDIRTRYITNCREAFMAIGGCAALSSQVCQHTNLVIDGGNIIKCMDKHGKQCVIMTTKVLFENPCLSHYSIIKELSELFDAEIIFIPWDMAEKFGHADGMIRFIEKGRLLMNCYSDMDPELGAILRRSLANRFEIHELKYDSKFRKNSWCHLNYLELSESVLVPTASLASDKPALKQIEDYLGKKSIPISMASVVAHSGAMHCISWSMNTDIFDNYNIDYTKPCIR